MGHINILTLQIHSIMYISSLASWSDTLYELFGILFLIPVPILKVEVTDQSWVVLGPWSSVLSE